MRRQDGQASGIQYFLSLDSLHYLYLIILSQPRSLAVIGNRLLCRRFYIEKKNKGDFLDLLFKTPVIPRVLPFHYLAK